VVDYDKAKEKVGINQFKSYKGANFKLKVGELLSMIMKIKAHGDFEAAKKLVDTYGLKIDVQLRDQVIVQYIIQSDCD